MPHSVIFPSSSYYLTLATLFMRLKKTKWQREREQTTIITHSNYYASQCKRIIAFILWELWESISWVHRHSSCFSVAHEIKLTIQRSSAISLTYYESLVESRSWALLLHLEAQCSRVNLYPPVKGVSDWVIRFCVSPCLPPSLNYHHVGPADVPSGRSRPLPLIEA